MKKSSQKYFDINKIPLSKLVKFNSKILLFAEMERVMSDDFSFQKWQCPIYLFYSKEKGNIKRSCAADWGL